VADSRGRRPPSPLFTGCILKLVEILHEDALFLHKIFNNFLGSGSHIPAHPLSLYSKFLDLPLTLWATSVHFRLCVHFLVCRWPVGRPSFVNDRFLWTHVSLYACSLTDFLLHTEIFSWSWKILNALQTVRFRDWTLLPRVGNWNVRYHVLWLPGTFAHRAKMMWTVELKTSGAKVPVNESSIIPASLGLKFAVSDWNLWNIGYGKTACLRVVLDKCDKNWCVENGN